VCVCVCVCDFVCAFARVVNHTQREWPGICFVCVLPSWMPRCETKAIWPWTSGVSVQLQPQNGGTTCEGGRAYTELHGRVQEATRENVQDAALPPVYIDGRPRVEAPTFVPNSSKCNERDGVAVHKRLCCSSAGSAAR
jgi:hypothetical protein